MRWSNRSRRFEVGNMTGNNWRTLKGAPAFFGV